MCEPLRDKLTENRFVRLFLYGMNRDFEHHKPLNPTPEQGETISIELQQLFENIRNDVKSAVVFFEKYYDPDDAPDDLYFLWEDNKENRKWSWEIWLFRYCFGDVIE